MASGFDPMDTLVRGTVGSMLLLGRRAPARRKEVRLWHLVTQAGVALAG